MKTGKFAVLGVVAAGVVALAVSSVVAQAPQEERARQQAERAERVGPRAMMLQGRGAQIGVTVEDLTEQELKAAAEAESAVRIADVDPDSPASRAGLREGDLVVEFEGDRVRSARQFSRLVQETPPGRSVTLGIVRDGKRETLNVTPEAPAVGWWFDDDLIGREIERSMRDIEPRLRELEPRLRELEPRLREFRYNRPFAFDFEWDELPLLTSLHARIGVQLQELTPQLAEYFGAEGGGVLVASVAPDSPAQAAGLRAGDVITSIDGDRVRDAGDVMDELRDKEGKVAVGIVRDKKETSTFMIW